MTAARERVFGDTSYFFACLASLDLRHERALALAARSADEGWDVYTTWDVVSETVTLLRYRAGHPAALAFLDDVRPTLRIVEYGPVVRGEAEAVFRRYGRERRLSWCDAVSFAVITGLLGRIPCLTFDADFRALGLAVLD